MTEPLHIPQITMVAITDKDYGPTIEAIIKSLKLIKPARTILFSDVYFENPLFECIIIPPMRSARKYNEFVTWELGKYPIDTSHILLIQHDGFVLNAEAWDDEYLKYDYIGAPWCYTDGRNVGNGGFSMRSTYLHKVLSKDPNIELGSPEDEIICRYYRNYLEKAHNVRYAPEELASKFSYEMQPPRQKTFGSHNSSHPQYREPIIIKRSHAMGDIIMAEPVMEYFYNKGYRVILDSLPHFYNLFAHHYYPIEHISMLREDLSNARVINLDMAYEVNPKQLALKSYFQAAGVTDYELKNPRLAFAPTQDTKLFSKYALIHVNKTDMPHRNLLMDHNNWTAIKNYLKDLGYIIFQIGDNDISTKINTHNQNMLGYIIAGADLFIGSDSGPAHIAVACGVKSAVFFGSVKPEYRYPDMSRILPLQQPCQFAGCYHEVIGARGQDCQIDAERPPCTKHTAREIIEKLNQFI